MVALIDELTLGEKKKLKMLFTAKCKSWPNVISEFGVLLSLPDV